MKAKRNMKVEGASEETQVLKEAVAVYHVEPAPMMRTQIYLSQREHNFLQVEAKRRGEPMAAVIRGFIDEKMAVPEDAWTNNPMLRGATVDQSWKGREDGARNKDHYLYGAPKEWIKVKGKWVKAPELPEDYFENGASREAYDQKLQKLDETK